MSFKEVKELRKSGNLEEALKMALEDLAKAETGSDYFVISTLNVSEAGVLENQNSNELNSEDGKMKIVNENNLIWAKRAAAWVYYDYLKKFSEPQFFEYFKENLLKIKALKLPADEQMIFDNCAYQIGSLVYSLQKEENVDYVKINELFDIIKDLHFTKPSEAYSFIYKAFHKGYQNWSKYLQFSDWWNFKNFRPEDYLKEEFNARKIMSIVEQAYIAYSKKLLEGESTDSFGQQRVIDREKVQSFLPQLDAIIEKYIEYQYLPYFKAKLLLALGTDESVLSAFLPFAKQKRNEFWVWELMAEIFSEESDTQFACYCKALSLNTPEDFLVKLRQTFAGILVTRQMYNEAKTEIEKICEIRAKNEWRLPNQISQWKEQDWFKSATLQSDNKELYTRYVKTAEEILFQDIQEENIVVEFINESKNLLNFVKDKFKHGFFNYSGHIDKPQVGDILSVRFNGKGQDGFYKILTAKKAASNITIDAIKNFQGTLRLIAPLNFGFVEDVYIDSKLIQEKNMTVAQNIAGKAILSFNKKKNEWGWKAIELK